MNRSQIIIYIVMFLFLPCVSFPYQLNGEIEHDGDKTYSVNLQNDYGHEYVGEAEDNGDGTLSVQVEDDNGQSYSGTATELSTGNGEYDLDLQNDSSGGSAEGTATLEK